MEIYVLNYINQSGKHSEHNFLMLTEYFYLNVILSAAAVYHH